MRTSILDMLWLIPALPLLAAGMIALLPRRHRTLAASLAIGTLALSFFLAVWAFFTTLSPRAAQPLTAGFSWLSLGEHVVRLGWILDPLTAVMLVMVTFVGALIFIYSVGYMAHDENFTRFFCFLSLFAAAMLGLVIANHLLLLFICWELVGLASYLLIGFWFQKPSAAAAAKKAFITTRIGDLGFLLGMVWLYAETGTLLFYDNGAGCLEQNAVTRLATQTLAGGMALSTAIALLIFCGAVGKSGQLPLHVWLPDAMEGPTPVSALIHAATMVAAGVFLVARTYPLFAAQLGGGAAPTPALEVVTWVGAITAVFAALIAVAQTDIKRILAYSTVSQLGFMMLGLGTGGVVVGMFHLITHAFFKALLFLGAGSVIHGVHEEQDIRFMGGLRKFMPVTFATYAVGMMALAGVPIFFSGFWSKDEILHAARHWPMSSIPFWLAVTGALLTAFYMTRQVSYVFFGERRVPTPQPGPKHHGAEIAAPHESPAVMVVPLVILAIFAVLLGLIGTPAWPWFHDYFTGHHTTLDLSRITQGEVLSVLLLSSVVVALGIGGGWLMYGRRPPRSAAEPDVLAKSLGPAYRLLEHKFFADELYQATVVRMHRLLAGISHWFDLYVLGLVVAVVSAVVVGLSWVNRFIDEYLVNGGFDGGCRSFRVGAWVLSRLQNGQVQRYLGLLGIGVGLLILLLVWGS